MELTIRDAAEFEFEIINNVVLESWKSLKSGYDPDEWEPILARIGDMKRIIGKGDILVALLGDEIVGAVGYVAPGLSANGMFPDDWACIRMLVVLPQYRGLGIGKKLTFACLDRAKDSNVSCVGLHTSPIMEVALPMYLKLGFSKVKDIPKIAGAPYSIYSMEL